MTGPITQPVPKPAPEPDEVSLPYWTAAREGRLVVQRCTSCGKAQFPPDLLCRYCQQPDPPFVGIDGRGTIYTFAIYTRSFSPAFEVPYALALVTLDACPEVRMMTNIVEADLAELAIGDAVEVTFEKRGDWALPQFRPAQGAGA